MNLAYGWAVYIFVMAFFIIAPVATTNRSSVKIAVADITKGPTIVGSSGRNTPSNCRVLITISILLL